MRSLKNVLITGGCGFIGSNFIHFLFSQPTFKGCIINLDKLTYAGSLENLQDIQERYFNDRYFFIKGDICDFHLLGEVFRTYNIDTVVHFAAESHVDRSILGPAPFMKTNIDGTFILLEVARKYWLAHPSKINTYIFHHISTDEVYGSLDNGYFTENSAYSPNSPYAASKAASDHLVRAYYKTYGLPVIISNCTNNYGPHQFPEKFIPLAILNGIEGRPIPVYGDGSNIRDWLYVEDHCHALWSILRYGGTGETYNIAGNNEQRNIEVVRKICYVLDETLGLLNGRSRKELIIFTKDRPGHDYRYALDISKIKEELGWSPKESFDTGLRKTIEWYLKNTSWVERVKSGLYKKWIKEFYGQVLER